MSRRLIQWREKNAGTQADLATLTGWRAEDADNKKAKGLSPSRIGNYEQGTRLIDHEAAAILAKVSGLPEAYWLVVLDEREAQVIVAMRQTNR